MQNAGLSTALLRPHLPTVASVCMVQSILTNHTGCGESAAFPVATPLVFRDLTLLYRYADGTRSAVPLYDSMHGRRTDLDPSMFFVRGSAFPVRHPDHGYLSKVILKGYFGSTLLQVLPEVSGGSFVAEVEADFHLTLTHPSTDSFVTVYARDDCDNRYAVGTFSMVEAVRQIDSRERLVLAK